MGYPQPQGLVHLCPPLRHGSLHLLEHHSYRFLQKQELWGKSLNTISKLGFTAWLLRRVHIFLDLSNDVIKLDMYLTFLFVSIGQISCSFSHNFICSEITRIRWNDGEGVGKEQATWGRWWRWWGWRRWMSSDRTVTAVIINSMRH